VEWQGIEPQSWMSGLTISAFSANWARASGLQEFILILTTSKDTKKTVENSNELLKKSHAYEYVS
jgi:hypothetical protein